MYMQRKKDSQSVVSQQTKNLLFFHGIGEKKRKKAKETYVGKLAK